LIKRERTLAAMQRSSMASEVARKLIQQALSREREIFARRVAPLLKRLEELNRMKRGPDFRLVTVGAASE
jgi:hypothetical protein